MLEIEYEKVDKRVAGKIPIVYDEVHTDFFDGVTLHDYQVEICNAALEKRYGIVKCATGGGKTVMMGAILKAMRFAYPTLLLFRNVSLVDQTYDAFLKLGMEGSVGRWVEKRTHYTDHSEYTLVSTIHSSSHAQLSNPFTNLKKFVLNSAC